MNHYTIEELKKSLERCRPCCSKDAAGSTSLTGGSGSGPAAPKPVDLSDLKDIEDDFDAEATARTKELQKALDEAKQLEKEE